MRTVPRSNDVHVAAARQNNFMRSKRGTAEMNQRVLRTIAQRRRERVCSVEMPNAEMSQTVLDAAERKGTLRTKGRQC